jgi:putative PIN family toxin of toxin-antitoxin system
MKTTRVVLDTNVVVSAHLKSEGYERHVLDLVLAGKLQLAVTEAILGEYGDVLSRAKFSIGAKHVARSMRLIRGVARIVRPQHELNVTSHSADNRFLECAEVARADYLVTGNKRHFPKSWRQTLVVNAHELLEWVAPELRR